MTPPVQPWQLLVVEPRAPLREFFTLLQERGVLDMRSFASWTDLSEVTLKPARRILLLSTWRLPGSPRAIIQDVRRQLEEIPTIVLLGPGDDRSAPEWLEPPVRQVLATPTRLRAIKRVIDEIISQCPPES